MRSNGGRKEDENDANAIVVCKEEEGIMLADLTNTQGKKGGRKGTCGNETAEKKE